MPQLHANPRAAKNTRASKGGANATAKAPPPPREIAVALATLVDAAPEGRDWVHELKLDGYRMVCRIDKGKIRLITRNGNEWTARAPSVVAAAADLQVQNGLLDGELVYLRADGVTDFQALQNALRNGKSDTLIYFAFDLLFLNGEDTRGLSLLDRKALLAELLAQEQSDPGRLRLSEHVVGQGPEFFRKAGEMGLEGIISKRSAAPYRSGRGRDWLKVKCTARQEVVIVGYTNPRGSRQHLGALLVATRDNATLRYAGKVGTGFSQQSLADVHRVLRAHQRAKPACANAPKGSAARAATWVDPIYVAEVEFTEFTSDGMMRHPTFRGLREDKPAAQVVRERAKPLLAKAPVGTPTPRAKKSKSRPAVG